jgi:hypothetical protein|tara:strand:- start:317 stop:562 length:246 start_codon:yes stop_codon:yes gene_type:complete
MDRTMMTVEAVKEALEFIEDNWGTWEGDLHMLMANVISDERVTTHDVRYLLRALSEGEPIQGLENLLAEKEGSNYKVTIQR